MNKDQLTPEQYESALLITGILCQIKARDYSTEELPDDEDIRLTESGAVEIFDGNKWWGEDAADQEQLSYVPENMVYDGQYND